MAKTIEAYKLRTEIQVDAAKGSAAMKGFQKTTDDTVKSLEKLGPTTERSTRKMADSFKALKSTTGIGGQGGGGGFLPGLGNISEIIQGIPQIGRLAGSLIRPLTDAAEAGIRLNMVLETAQIGFEGVAGSAEAAKKHITALQEFGKKSPFRFEGLLEASRFMTAFGFSLDEQIPKLTIWGNAIAASGELSADKINDVVRAFGQMRMAGRVNAQDMNQLTNANIPGWELLAKSIGKTVAQTRKLAEAGKLKGGPAVEAITAQMAIDPRYKDMMKRMESTGLGRLSAAQDIQEFAQAKATEGLTRDISDTLGMALQNENLVNDMAGSINKALTPVSGIIKSAAATLLGGGLTSGFVEGIDAGKEAVKEAVGDFALDGIIGTAKGWLGIDSPSTVFIEIGKQSAEGFNIGFAAGLSGFDDVIQGFITQAKDSLRARLENLLTDPRIQALLKTVKTAEGGALNRMVGGREVLSGARHPGEIIPKSQWFKGDKGRSSAAGNYQITLTNWRHWAPILGLDNFSDPHQQELVALAIMNDRPGGGAALQSGDPNRMMDLAAKDYTSTPGSRIGGGGQWSKNRWMGTFNQALSSGGGSSGAVPVVVTNFGGQGGGGGWGAPADITGGAKAIFGSGAPGDAAQTASTLSAWSQTITDTEPVLVEVNVASEALLQTNRKQEQAIVKMGTVTYKAITPIEDLTAATVQHADAAIASTKKMQADTLKGMTDAEEATSQTLNKLGNAIQQAASFIPSEQNVGKKRGLFSKILGFAAPFLSFIPGAGPILSMAAGAASQGLAGNWGGVASTVGAGFQKGGAFNRDKEEGRARGGPVYRGERYIVGEAGWETFTPSVDGYITPHGMSGPGGAGGAMAEAAAELRAAVQHLSSMPAHQVVMRGAHGIVRAMDHDAGLIRLVSQRQRLA